MNMNTLFSNVKVGFLFDLDGVLIDSEKEYSKIWAQINHEYPSGKDNLEVVIKGCTLDKILADNYPDADIQKKVTERLYELEGKMRYRYLPGAFELLRSLKERDMPAVMVTSSNDDKMAHLDEELPDIRSYFTYIVTANQITESKPDPEGYILGAARIGLRATDCIVFEDSIQGVTAGQNAGAYVVGVAGTNTSEALQPFSDMVVDSLIDIDVDILIGSLQRKKSERMEL